MSGNSFISIHFQKYGIFMVLVVLLWYMFTEQWFYDHMSKNIMFNVSQMICQRLFTLCQKAIDNASII